LSHALTTRDLALAGLFAALISVGALVSVPMFGPVPLTFQVLFVLLGGLVLGARLGALSVVVYLAVGLVAPVYAQGASGLGALFGPAGGYLFGFVIAAWLVGMIVQRLNTRSTPGLCAAALVGLVPIYAVGAIWLSWQLGTTDTHLIAWGGVVQFLPGDIAKASVAALAARALFSLPLGLPVPARSR
jgi:biotin transport system substrate-specific component